MLESILQNEASYRSNLKLLDQNKSVHSISLDYQQLMQPKTVKGNSNLNVFNKNDDGIMALPKIK